MVNPRRRSASTKALKSVLGNTDSMLKEHEKLRAELQTLKQCQLQYFWSSVTVTGLILGIGTKLDGNLSGDAVLQAVFFFAPLLVILPCWLVFFDKATTITRIVGYSRVLERMTLRPLNTRYAYVGWENALRLFREHQIEERKGLSIWRRFGGYLRDSIWGVLNLFDFSAIHRYWNLTWLTFAGLAALCLSLGWVIKPTGAKGQSSVLLPMDLLYPLQLIFCFAALVAIIHTSYLFYQLTGRRGRSSYNNNESAWQVVLESEKSHKHLDCFTEIANK